MKMVKTEFSRKVNECSSYIVYIARTYEEARSLHNFAMTYKEMLLESGPSWYYSVSTVSVDKDCRVPEFFHDKGLFATIIEHNNGDWKAPRKYDLYIVE